ncbi:MAG: aquaporin [Acidobacteria bacterium]|nr:aquaporin [Acidobacteriota bacterium]
MNPNLKPAIAELIGTFTLVFIGAGAGALATTSGAGLVGVALAHGIALMVIVYTWGPISGAHANPAVTFAMLVRQRMTWVSVLWYWAAQLFGAALAGFALRGIIGNVNGLGATIGLLTSDAGKTILLEAILTFLLVITIYGTAVVGRSGNAVGLAIGFVLTMDILMGGALTGASMNPARTFGPAIATGDLSYWWMYIMGPFLGAFAAAFTYDTFFHSGGEAQPRP